MLKTGHRTKYHLRAFEFLAARRRSRAVLTCTLLASFLATMPTGGLQAGDILRGGASAGNAKRNSEARANAGAAAAEAAKVRAQDRLARTTKAVNDMRALQASARAAAGASAIPNGITQGGLQPQLKAGVGIKAIYTKDDFQNWDGADAPTPAGNTVNIKQTAAQALLHWETFNVGSQTTVNFDQSAGGADSGKWIAFNKVSDPTGKPSEIRGKINAQGQVYIINQNGIIFGAGSQVNARTLVASSLPINDKLVERGLLNQEKSAAEFLFSNSAQGGAAAPPPPSTANGQIGDVVVLPGAQITTSVSPEGGGGRVMLVGPNVAQGGAITTPSGQTIIAAGLQVGVSAHSSSDPSLRGLDVFIGDVGAYGGTAQNTGVIFVPTGSLTMAGKRVEQNGVIEGLTTVTLNSRVDLLANFDALPNGNFDPAILNSQDPFLHRSTGTVTLGARSAIQIMPDSSSGALTVGTKLPLPTQINIQGLDLHFGESSTILAPNGNFAARSGIWGAVDDFVHTDGEILLESGAMIDVSGSADVFVPRSDSILEIQLRGNELSMSPVQRAGKLRGKNLTVDARRTGTYNGRQWIGTPLGDASGFLDIIERNAPQLSATGGSILLQSGRAVTAKTGSVLDVSGGFFRHEGGRVQTTRFLYQGRHIIDIADATPDRLYDGVYEGKTSTTSVKWGVTRMFSTPLAPLGVSTEQSYIAGAAGGSLSIAAPGMSLDGSVLGQTIAGPRQVRKNIQLSEMPATSSLSLRFEGQQIPAPGTTTYDMVSPTPPRVILGGPAISDAGRIMTRSLVSQTPVLAELTIPENFFESSGFGSLDIKNDDGEFIVPAESNLQLPAYTTVSATGRTIDIRGSISSPGGSLSFTATHVSPYLTEIENGLIINYPGPVRDLARGSVTLGPSSRLDVAGLVLDDRATAPATSSVLPVAIDGGTINLTGLNVTIPEGASLDVSGGLIADVFGDYAYGDAGSISISAGNDPNYPSLLGGRLVIAGSLSGFAGLDKDGGSLAIKAPFIQIGGAAPLHSNSLVLDPSFFSRGGFQSFALTGIGAAIEGFVVNPLDPEAPQPFTPAVYVAPGTVVEPIIESLAYAQIVGDEARAGIRRIVRPLGERPPVSISLIASTIRNDFADPSFGGNPDGDSGRVLVVRGDVVLSEGARIQTEPGGDLTLRGSTVTVLGSLIAPGGQIAIAGANSFPQTKFLEALATSALTTVYIGPRASISAAGAPVYDPDSFGRRVGQVYDGGRIAVSGNIVAESGAKLDVSGASGIFDFHPSALRPAGRGEVPVTSGLNTMPYSLRTVPYQVDSAGGTIALAGSQFLYYNAALTGSSGGPTAVGGVLQVSSGRFYLTDAPQATADINMVVSQSESALFDGRARAIGRPVRDRADVIRQGNGHFAVDTFVQGGFDSLDLNFYYDRNTQPVPQGGNIQFDSDVSISARGFLRVAGGGVIQANRAVRLAAPYIAIGQAFAQPGDDFEPFRKFDTVLGATRDYFPPTAGSGSVSVDAQLLDVGTLVLRSIGSASLSARGGDIRGSGSLNIVGSLTLEAAQIYPVTLGDFSIFAYDGAGTQGSIAVRQSGTASAPLSAGGSLRLFASQINQSGTLLAPFGSITIGWDGTDDDLSTVALDQPSNPVVGAALNVSTSQVVTLGSGSLTSVAGVDFATGTELLVPFGLSRDGVSILDPSGVNITSAGLPAKGIVVAGELIETQAGSIIDIRGGGDLLAYRWVSGLGGAVDLLGTPSGEWLSGEIYSAGNLVSYEGKTYSARVLIDPSNFALNQGPKPEINRYWHEVEESYAIVPGFSSRFAPQNPFNTITAASLEALAGDPGYVSNSLQIGDQIYLDGGSGLTAGSYTLLPRRYGLLPGAFVVTPKSGKPRGAYTNAEGSSFVTGYRINALNQPSATSSVRSLYEVAAPEVIAGRSAYEVFNLSSFLRSAAERLNLDDVQRLPRDSGSLLLSGNSAMSLAGTVLSRPVSALGRGSMIDIASFADIKIVGNGQPGAGNVVLNAGTLSSFGAESLIVGGIRRQRTDGDYDIEIRTQNISVNNAGTPLQGPDILLSSRRTLSFQSGAQLLASGSAREPAERYHVAGDGVLARTSTDSSSRVFRSGFTASNLPLLTVASGAQITGASVALDSSYGFSLDPGAVVSANRLTLGAGQISILLSATGGLPGQLVNPQLVLTGSILQQFQSLSQLNLVAYQNTIDIYGPGVFGGSALELLTMQAGEIRGFNQGAESSTFRAGGIELSNPLNIAASGPIAAPTGTLVFDAGTITVGSGNSMVSQYANLVLNASSGILFTGTGGLSAKQNIVANTPLVTAASGARQNLRADGSLELNRSGGAAGIQDGLAGSLNLRGTSVTSTTDIRLPSGLINIQATGAGGDVTIGGILDTSGRRFTFYDVDRVTNAGEIVITSESGDVTLLPGSFLSVAADVAGGDAGFVTINAPLGQFASLGKFEGSAGAGGLGGEFKLDAGSLASFEALRDLLNAGGLNESRDIRVRTGNIVLTGTTAVRRFILSTDSGGITVTGTVDASGVTGGSIRLISRGDLVLAPGSILTAAAQEFDSSGKGGQIYLEAGASTGGTTGPGVVDIQTGSLIDLNVAAYQQGATALPNGDFQDVTSSAFLGQFRGTLHVRGPQIAGNTDVAVNKILGSITGASSVLVEGYRIYSPGGVMNIALRDLIDTDATSFIDPNEVAMRAKLFGGTVNAGLDDILVVAPGAEIVNAGDLVLGLENNTAAGSTNIEGRTTADWDLSSFRYGSRQASGVLTLRAAGDLFFNNALSDGFTPVANTGTNGNSILWLATPQAINPLLPINTQSWSFRLTAGADLASASAARVLPVYTLASGIGSIFVGEFHPAATTDTTGTDATENDAGRTLNHIRISRTSNLANAMNDRGTRFEVIRTGTGSIDLNAGRDVQLRNTFATIYTAGVAIPTANQTRIFEANDFVVPILTRFQGGSPPIEAGGLGAVQQTYGVFYTLAGGDISVQAGENIGRFTQFGGAVIADSARQLPSNWLLRRGYEDSTGVFGQGGVIGSGSSGSVVDASASTTWWINFSNFFQGIGALGGGDISLIAGQDIVNADAVIPTNARVKGLDSLGVNLAPDTANLLEHGGGDLVVRAGDAIDGGSYYVERGNGILAAGGDITTNAGRSLSLGVLSGVAVDPATSLSWLPTVLYVGKSHFDVFARGSALLGPTTNPFLLPQGTTNRFWYKTQFNTFSEGSGVSVAAYGGDVTHRLVDRDGRPILFGWADVQNTLAANTAAFRQPWLRLAESTINQGSSIGIGSYGVSLSLAAPNLSTASFSGDVNIVGKLNLYPSPTGALEILAAGAIPGLQPVAFDPVTQTTTWTSAQISVSDASPSKFPGVANPLAFQAIMSDSRAQADLLNTQQDPLGAVVLSIVETGAIEGSEASIVRQDALHDATILHADDQEPLRIYALDGDIAAVTLFAPKATRVIASRDITDIGFYLQNAREDSISVVSAGRDLILFNENYALRTQATSEGNSLLDQEVETTTTSTRALTGDIQMSGQGTLEIFAGRDIDLGTGANFLEGGLGKGITSIGRRRNPYLPIDGARLVVLAGVTSKSGGPSLSLASTNLGFQSFRNTYLSGISSSIVDRLSEASQVLLADLNSLSDEQKNILALDVFFALLQQSSEDFAETGSYETGFAAIESLFGSTSSFRGDILTRARDIRTASGGGISLLTPGGDTTMASDIFGNPLTPPGIVTALGGPVSIFMDGSLSIGAARVFTLRGGDITIWSSGGDIAAGSAAKTVVSAPPTRVTIDATSGEVVTDLGGLATGGGIGVLASVEGVEPGGVFLIAPEGTVDAGDAGIRATGDITIAAATVVNADNIAAGGTSSGVPAAAAPASISVSGLTSASTTSGAANSAATRISEQSRQQIPDEEEAPSEFVVEILGYGGEG